MNMLRWTAVVATMVGVAGCASTPAGRFTYYLPKADTRVTLTQTLACNSKKTTLIQVMSVTTATTYSSDIDAGVQRVEPSKLGGFYADTDILPTFYSGGRLQGINASSTGQGGTYIKDALIVAKAAALAAASAHGPASPTDISNVCDTITNYSSPAAPAKGGGTDETKAPPTLTLVYSASVGFHEDSSTESAAVLSLSDGKGGVSQQLSLEPDANSASAYNELSNDIDLHFLLNINPTTPKLQAVHWEDATTDVQLPLNSLAMAELSITNTKGAIIWQDHVSVPLTGKNDIFYIPVPKAALFGTEKFSLSLSEAGEVTKFEYSKSGDTDAADAAAQIGAFIAQQKTDLTAAQKAAEAGSEADRIYENNRLAICRADPTKCPSK